MLTTALVFKYAFNYRDGDIFFCSADLGWITGHTANVYGALANGATAVLFDGLPTHPNSGRFWQIIDEYKVNAFYTAPTAVRTLMKFGDEFVNKYAMSDLKLLALVGEPINREAWLWMYNVVGRGKCPIVDTYFQTETVCPFVQQLIKIYNNFLSKGSADDISNTWLCTNETRIRYSPVLRDTSRHSQR